MTYFFKRLSTIPIFFITFVLKVVLFFFYIFFLFLSAIWAKFFRDDLGLRSKPAWKKFDDIPDICEFLKEQ